MTETSRDTHAAHGCSCRNASAPNEDRSFVYSIGRIRPVFSTRGLEREYQQVVSAFRPDGGATDAEALHAVLSDPANRYLARQLSWVLSIEGIDTYALAIRHHSDISLLIESVRAARRPSDIDVVIGVRAGLAPRHAGHAVRLPMVLVDHTYSFDIESFVKQLDAPGGRGKSNKKRSQSTEELFLRISQLVDNAGNSDDHRALNYLAVRYDGIYHKTADAHARNMSLASVEVRPSRLSGARTIVEVIFTFTERTSMAAESWFVRVDVSDQFPFLVTPLTQFFER